MNVAQSLAASGRARRPAPPEKPPIGGWTRHLIYYVCPVAGNGTWQRNVRQLLDRIDLFNGRRLVAVAAGGGEHCPPGRVRHFLDPPDAVRAALAGHGVDVIEVPANPVSRETVAFYPLWEAVAGYVGEGDCTFFAHAKGVSYRTDEKPAAHIWTTLLYATCLDYWPLVESFLLGRRPTVGTFLHAPGKRNWYWSGAFYWFRNRVAFGRAWRKCTGHWMDIERWPGRVFRPPEAGVLFRDEPPDIYGLDTMRTFALEFVGWSAAHAIHRRLGAPTTFEEICP